MSVEKNTNLDVKLRKSDTLSLYHTLALDARALLEFALVKESTSRLAAILFREAVHYCSPVTILQPEVSIREEFLQYVSDLAALGTGVWREDSLREGPEVGRIGRELLRRDPHR
jgi:hypothetical protein